ncbi:ABC transporter substrate-binding protein [Pseudonocardia sp. MH-G8]|uniref:ABC transporter substrate-binding protein n=1 Tax=Pseudonocardia sp. MH-G8 TaxID=1854588 RepID=UPI0018E9BBCA|nr:ABC transporter substrate-binding protein [Pseudonocardia sp. MH-G8]
MKIVATWMGVASVAVMALAACGGAPVPAAAGPGAATTVQSCGQTLAFAAPPQRAVALEQNATEIMLSLGLADRMAGTSYRTDPVLDELAEAYAGVPVLAEQYPAREALLAAEPDFTYSTFASAYAPEAAGSREDLAALGVPAYLSAHSCPDRAPGPVPFDAIMQEITDIGTVFGVPERAAALVAEQRARLAAATGTSTPERSVLWYYSGTSTPHVAGSGGLAATMSEVVGVRNAFDDAPQAWVEGSWEEIAERDPDVFVLADLTRGGDGDSAQSKIDFLRAHPVASQLRAVREGAFIVVPGSTLDPSIRSVSAVEAVSAGLQEVGT